MNEDAKTKLLEELLELQKMLEGKIEVQDNKIKKLHRQQHVQPARHHSGRRSGKLCQRDA